MRNNVVKTNEMENIDSITRQTNTVLITIRLVLIIYDINKCGLVTAENLKYTSSLQSVILFLKVYSNYWLFRAWTLKNWL